MQHLGISTKKAKFFAKKLHDDYRSKACGIVEAYARFEAFSEELAQALDDSETVEGNIPRTGVPALAGVLVLVTVYRQLVRLCGPQQYIKNRKYIKTIKHIEYKNSNYI